MGRFWSFWKHDNSRDEDMSHSIALSQQQADAANQTDPVIEAAKLAERERLLTSDQRVAQFLDTHHHYRAFIPALSPVNRTTKHIGKTDAIVAWLDFQILATLTEMTMPPEEFENGALEIMQGLEMLHNTQISDGYEGWKGKLVTENNKTIKTILSKQK